MKEKFEDGKKREDAGNNKLFTRMMETVDAGIKRFKEEMQELDPQALVKLRSIGVSENAIFRVRDEDLDQKES